MAGTYSGLYSYGISLTVNPNTITSTGTVRNNGSSHGGDGVYGAAAGTGWTLSNAGTVSSNPAHGAGIRLLAAQSTVTNSGRITGGPGYGVTLAAGGSVTNGAGGATAALISGSKGIKIDGSAGTAANFGTIVGTQDIGVALAFGGTFTNGTTGALVTGASIGAELMRFGTVANSGTIVGTSQMGVVLTQGGTVVNGAGGVSAALITGGVNGVYVKGASRVLSSGTITGTNLGVYFYDTGSLTNGASGATSGLIRGATGVDVYSTGTVTNFGTISGTGGTAVNIHGSNNNRVIVGAGATFTGTVKASGTANTLELASSVGIGTLSGLGTAFTGFDRVAVDAGASWGLAGGNTIGSGVSLTDSGTVTNSGTILTAATVSSGGSFDNAASGRFGNGIYGVRGVGGPVTVSNEGTITGTRAVELDAGGIVTNGAGGATAARISGSSIGVLGFNVADTVVNFGTIVGTSLGVELVAAGAVTNGASGAATALISGGTGIKILNASGTVTNFGTVVGGIYAAYLYGTNNNRVLFGAGATFTGTVKALGTVNTLELASSVGVGTLTGFGTQFVGFDHVTIDAGASWGLAGGNTIGAGVSLIDSGTAQNVGTVATTATVTNGGSFDNAAGGRVTVSNTYGVYGITGLVTVSNEGTIAAPGGLSAVGVYLKSGGFVTNGAGGATAAQINGGFDGVLVTGSAGTVSNLATITGTRGIELDAGGLVRNGATGATAARISGGAGILAFGAAATVVNFGTILGTSSYGIGITDGGSVTNGASGATTGLIAGNSYGVKFSNVAGTVTNFGTISGANGTAVNLSGVNNNRVVFGAGATFTGTVAATGTANTLELAPGVGIGTLSGFGAAFTGFDRVAVDAGASWSFAAGNTIGAGVTLSDSGTLKNAGTILTAATVTSAGSFDNAMGGLVTVSNTAGIVGIGPATVSNEGTITAPGGLGSEGVYLKAGGNVTNGASGATTALINGGFAGVLLKIGGAVVNFATITGQRGIELDAGGTVINGATVASAARISGSSLGVVAYAAATVTNLGTIAGASAGAIELLAGGRVTNGVSGSTAALISSSSYGVYMSTAAGTVTNFGTIAGSPFAVRLQGTNNNRVVFGAGATFTGTVAATGTANTLELAASVGIGTLSGFGTQFVGFDHVTIDSGTSWTFAAGNTIGAGVSLIDSGTVQNIGTVATTTTVASGGSFDNALGGLVSVSSGYGVSGTGGPVTVSNEGTITRPGGSGANGVVLGAGGSLINGAGAPTALISGGLNGVSVFGSAGTVTNLATITGGIGIGVRLSSGGIVRNGASGATAGRISGTIGVAAFNPASTVVNFGTIAGSYGTAVYLNGANYNRVVFGAGATFTGTVKATGTANTLELASSVGVGTLSGFGTQFTGFDRVTVDPTSSWLLNATAAGFVAPVNVGAGATAEIAGTVSAQETITLLAATGRVKLDAVPNFTGTIAGFQPGDTLAIAGTVDGTPILAGGVLTIVNTGSVQTIHLAGSLAGNTPIVRQVGNESDISLISSASPAEFYRFQYVFGDGTDYYYGTVSALAGQYAVGQRIPGTQPDQSGSVGAYTILADLGAGSVAVGSVQVSSYFAGVRQGYLTPYAASQGKLDGTSGLGTEFDYLAPAGSYTSYFGNFGGAGAASFNPYYEASREPQTAIQHSYAFQYGYGDGQDYYYGTVVASAGTYTANQVITPAHNDASGARGSYQILSDQGVTGLSYNRVQVSAYYSGVEARYLTPYAFSQGQASGSGGLGSEFDYVAPNGGYSAYFGNIGGANAGSSYPFYEVSRESGVLPTHQYSFEYVYGDGSDYYYGTVAAQPGTYAIGTVMRAALADQSGSRGFYEILADQGDTNRAAGTVQATAYFDRATNAYYTPYAASVGSFDGSAGLGTEFDYLNIHGGYTSYFGNIAGAGSSTPRPYYLGA